MAKHVYGNSVNSLDLVPIAMPISIGEAIKMGFKRRDIVFWQIGKHLYSCILIWGTPEQRDDWYRTVNRMAKQETRKNRCNIADGEGGFIKCPECNPCYDCPKIQSIDFDTMMDTSLDFLIEEDKEGCAEYQPVSHLDTANDAILNVILEDLMAYLKTFDGKHYYEVFVMIAIDNATIAEIARYLHITWSAANWKAEKVQELSQEHSHLKKDDFHH